MLPDVSPVRIGLIGDIHANLPALKATLRTLNENGVRLTVNCGDFVGYNAFPEEVIRLCRQNRVLSVIGNYDQKVLKFTKRADKWKKSKHPEKWFSFKWSRENLSNESLLYLSCLPKKLEIKVLGRHILIVHGSPVSMQEHLFSTTPEDRFQDFTELTQADVVVFGHSHEPFAKQVGGTLFINTGSVGRADDGDPRATAAILEVGKNLKVQHLKILYDVNSAIQSILRKGLPENFALMVKNGRSLDWILENKSPDS
jgi:putative phosphoesterase